MKYETDWTGVVIYGFVWMLVAMFIAALVLGPLFV